MEERIRVGAAVRSRFSDGYSDGTAGCLMVAEEACRKAASMPTPMAKDFFSRFVNPKGVSGVGNGEETVTVLLMTDNTTHQPSDSELVALVQEGDHGAFEQLYRRHVGVVHGLAWRLSGDGGKAEEITQEVFFRAWKHRSSFSGGGHFRAWLMRVAVNLRRSEVRGEKRWGKPVAADFEAGEAIRQAPSTQWLQSDLEQAVAVLPAGARDVLVLHDIYGFKHAEISLMLGVAVGTCKVQLHRARRKLQEILR